MIDCIYRTEIISSNFLEYFSFACSHYNSYLTRLCVKVNTAVMKTINFHLF